MIHEKKNLGIEVADRQTYPSYPLYQGSDENVIFF